jgi:hypothetical protein
LGGTFSVQEEQTQQDPYRLIGKPTKPEAEHSPVSEVAVHEPAVTTLEMVFTVHPQPLSLDVEGLTQTA